MIKNFFYNNYIYCSNNVSSQIELCLPAKQKDFQLKELGESSRLKDI